MNAPVQSRERFDNFWKVVKSSGMFFSGNRLL